MTDAAKAKVWDAYVEPYGQAKVFGTPSAGLNIRLPGQFLEAESGGLHQNWFRNYDPTLGRYIEADPLGIDAGQNPYGYVDGRPLERTDVTGQCMPWCLIFAAGALSALIEAMDQYQDSGKITCWRNVAAQGAIGAVGAGLGIAGGGAAAAAGAGLGLRLGVEAIFSTMTGLTAGAVSSSLMGPSSGSAAYNNIGANTAGSVIGSAAGQVIGGRSGAAFGRRIGYTVGNIVSTYVGAWTGNTVTNSMKGS